MSDHRHQRTGRHAVSRRSEPLHLATEARGSRVSRQDLPERPARGREVPIPGKLRMPVRGTLRARFRLTYTGAGSASVRAARIIRPELLVSEAAQVLGQVDNPRRIGLFD